MNRVILRDIKRLTIEEVDRPVCPEDGLIVRVKACAVCATDVKIYNYGHSLLQLPRVLGHEIAGVIEEVGPAHGNRFSHGQRVAVCAVVNCGECVYCRRSIPSMCLNLKAFGYHFDGGYQEYMAVPNESIRCGGVNVLSSDLSFAEASVAELLACCINGQRLSDFRLGQNVLILGSGPVGILHTQLARAQGASDVYIADVIPAKLEQAKDICGDLLSGTLMSNDSEALVRQIMDMTDGYGFDQVMICCSAPSAQQVSLDVVAKCGCVNFFGGLPKGNSQVTLDTNLVHYKQCRVIGTHGSSADDNKLALDLISKGIINVKSLITKTIGLDALEDALQLNGSGSGLKTVVAFGSDCEG
ncbi:MAG: alcohol dehydrogenase catalytic domain-containing protein [Armatimonadota bacterium]